MFIVRSRNSIHGQNHKLFLHNSSSIFLHLLHNSSTNLQPHHFMVDYLINSLNFTKQEAITTSTKLFHLKSTKKPQSVIDFLKTHNLSQPQIKSIVISQPNILLRRVDKTLEPKFRVLSETGFSGSDILTVIKKDPNLLDRRVDTYIVPTINYMLRIMGTKENIVKAIERSPWPFYGKYFRVNVMLLQKYGFCRKDIERIILRNPRVVSQNRLRLESKLDQVEKEFGISPRSCVFSYGLSALCAMNESTLHKKFEMFRSFGWSDSDIEIIAKSQPLCFTISEERLSKMLSFFMEEVGYTSSRLATCGCVLKYSLEKRVKPRYQLFKVLRDEGVRVQEFHTIVYLSNINFMKNVVHRYKEDIPDHMYESFLKDVNGE
ncbi:uncharacterized protein [Rutidosis leptorrhynchoides]|uniref:uncharacterized protein n=1 Tax=Rutidosis leptorrhynchoides TaxID=125765 RepID=UPI003A99EAAD